MFVLGCLLFAGGLIAGLLGPVALNKLKELIQKQ